MMRLPLAVLAYCYAFVPLATRQSFVLAARRCADAARAPMSATARELECGVYVRRYGHLPFALAARPQKLVLATTRANLTETVARKIVALAPQLVELELRGASEALEHLALSRLERLALESGDHYQNDSGRWNEQNWPALTDLAVGNSDVDDFLRASSLTKLASLYVASPNDTSTDVRVRLPLFAQQMAEAAPALTELCLPQVCIDGRQLLSLLSGLPQLARLTLDNCHIEDAALGDADTRAAVQKRWTAVLTDHGIGAIRCRRFLSPSVLRRLLHALPRLVALALPVQFNYASTWAAFRESSAPVARLERLALSVNCEFGDKWSRMLHAATGLREFELHSDTANAARGGGGVGRLPIDAILVRLTRLETLVLAVKNMAFAFDDAATYTLPTLTRVDVNGCVGNDGFSGWSRLGERAPRLRELAIDARMLDPEAYRFGRWLPHLATVTVRTDRDSWAHGVFVAGRRASPLAHLTVVKFVEAARLLQRDVTPRLGDVRLDCVRLSASEASEASVVRLDSKRAYGDDSDSDGDEADGEGDIPHGIRALGRSDDTLAHMIRGVLHRHLPHLSVSIAPPRRFDSPRSSCADLWSPF